MRDWKVNVELEEEFELSGKLGSNGKVRPNWHRMHGCMPERWTSEPLEVQIAVEAQGRGVPEPDQGAPRNLLEPLGNHVCQACKISIVFVER